MEQLIKDPLPFPDQFRVGCFHILRQDFPGRTKVDRDMGKPAHQVILEDEGFLAVRGQEKPRLRLLELFVEPG